MSLGNLRPPVNSIKDMPTSFALPLLHNRTITLTGALEKESDILEELSRPDKRLDFACDLYVHSEQIKNIVAHHLRIPASACTIPWSNEWQHGSYNMCIPVYIDSGKNTQRKVMIRFPLPYKIGESTSPGNVEEKLRCEAATYAWIEEHCQSISIPRLYGYGLPRGGLSFTALDQAPFLTRVMWHLRQWYARLLGRTSASRYVHHPHRQGFDLGYLLVEYVSHGTMLSKKWVSNGAMRAQTWVTSEDDSERRANLFGDLSRVIHCLAQCRFPRIGSLAMDDSCVVALSNRPLTDHLLGLENDGIASGIPRDRTYEHTQSYALDLLACHDERLRKHPNAVNNTDDGALQCAVLTAVRALLPHFLEGKHHYGGPFCLQLTDLHASNIFVDDDWHITKLIDLEWACVRPLEMLYAPQILGGGVDQKADDMAMAPYREIHAEFVAAMEKVENEELQGSSANTLHCSTYMRMGLRTGSIWYFHALGSYSGMVNLFLRHIRTGYGPPSERRDDQLEETLSPYWQRGGIKAFVSDKVEQREKYKEDIKEFFLGAEKARKEEAEREAKAAAEKAAVEDMEEADEEHKQELEDSELRIGEGTLEP